MRANLTLFALYDPSSLDANWAVAPQAELTCGNLGERLQQRPFDVQTTRMPSGFALFHPADDYETAEQIQRNGGNGAPLRYALAGELAKIKFEAGFDQFDRAAIAYIRQLPSYTPIVLYWH